MNHEYRETEIKLYVPDLVTLEERLRAEGAELVRPRVYERNVRYDDEQRRLTGARKVLRLREDDGVHLTFKDDSAAPDGGPISRFEAEVAVDDFTTMEVILARLGFHPYLRYEKFRTIYRLDGVLVMLDEMPYGHFVEIEGESDAILAAVMRLGLREAPHMTASYSALFDRVRDRLGLSFDDLTFANFRGVAVPLSALE